MKTAGTFDEKLMLVDSSANVTSTVTGSAVDFNGPDMDELNIRIIVPSVSGTTPKIVAKIQESANGSDGWKDIYTFPDITAAGEYSKKMRGTLRYRRAVLTVSGTSPNFGFVKVGASTGGVR